MNLFELVLKLNNPSERKGWRETTAYFTGKCEKAAVGKPGHFKQAEYNEYEIRYMTNGKERLGWYTFHPLDDPDPDELKGTELRIRYHERKPWRFETIKNSSNS